MSPDTLAMSSASTSPALLSAWPFADPSGEYLVDAMQRTICSGTCCASAAMTITSTRRCRCRMCSASTPSWSSTPGRSSDPPTICSPASSRQPGVTIDPKKRPFVVVDPRAGHGPGIGGFKADSELGVAMRAGHPCYFVGFTPDPMPGKPSKTSCVQAVFLEKVIALHPDAEGKPCVIGNCQAGWAVMMLAAVRPELFGPIIVPGSPLVLLGGVKAKIRCATAAVCWAEAGSPRSAATWAQENSTGHALVGNFENLDPANTYWKKNYNLVKRRYRGGALS